MLAIAIGQLYETQIDTNFLMDQMTFSEITTEVELIGYLFEKFETLSDELVNKSATKIIKKTWKSFGKQQHNLVGQLHLKALKQFYQEYQVP